MASGSLFFTKSALGGDPYYRRYSLISEVNRKDLGTLQHQCTTLFGLIVKEGILLLTLILCHTGPRTQEFESVRLRLLNCNNHLYGWNSP